MEGQPPADTLGVRDQLSDHATSRMGIPYYVRSVAILSDTWVAINRVAEL